MTNAARAGGIHFELAYGRGAMGLDLPAADVVQVLRVADAPALGKDGLELRSHVLGALRLPISSPPLRDLARPGERVAVVVNDQTRVARTELFLPALLDELNRAGVPDSAVTCVFALGAHRPLEEGEMRALVGPEASRRVRLFNHDCRDRTRLTLLGLTSRGTPVWVNSTLVEADRVVLTGSIVHHFFAGFGGGRKAAVPGCAGLETIRANHALMLDSAAAIGRLDGNPVHEDLLEAARLLEPDFLFNVVLNSRQEVAGIFAGELDQAHRRGCVFAASIYGRPVERQTDLVVASCGGWPRDINMYQAQKALDHAAQAVRPGGVIILLAECPEGPGNQTYLEWMKRYRTPRAIAAAIRDRFELGGHKAYAVTRLLDRALVILVSAMPADLVRELLLLPAPDPAAALELARSRLGPRPSVTVMPDGGLTVPLCPASKTQR